MKSLVEWKFIYRGNCTQIKPEDVIDVTPQGVITITRDKETVRLGRRGDKGSLEPMRLDSPSDIRFVVACLAAGFQLRAEQDSNNQLRFIFKS